MQVNIDGLKKFFILSLNVSFLWQIKKIGILLIYGLCQYENQKKR